MPRPERPVPPPGEGDEAPPLITLRAMLLGLVTIAGTFYYIIQIAQKQGSGTYVQSQYPMSAFMPFVLWLFVNAALALILPRLSLRRGEMLTIFCMTWVVAVTPMWINFWASLLSAPTYFADDENRWADILFGHLPWEVFVPPTSRVVDNLWNGLPEGMSVPWDGWVETVVEWLGATGAATVFGYCLLVVFRHQWQENEKLPYPLAQLPRDLTAGFEQKRRLPKLFRSRLFWIGFAVVVLPQIHNIVTYFVPGLPTFGLFWDYYRYWFDHGLVYGFIRVMPLILMVVYLCPVHILGSIVIFHVLATFKMGLIRRYGAPDIGFASTDMRLFLWTESHGALVFVGLWSIWIARRHLRGIWRQVLSGEGDQREVLSYRMALVGLVVSGLYVVGWAVSMGVSLPMAVGSFGLMVIAYFVTVKMVAASGIALSLPPAGLPEGGCLLPGAGRFDLRAGAAAGALQGFHQLCLSGPLHHSGVAGDRAPPADFLPETAAGVGGRGGAGELPGGIRRCPVGPARPGLHRGGSDLSVAQDHMGVQRPGPPHQQSHRAQPGQMGPVVGWFFGGGGPHPAAQPLPLAAPPSHRPDRADDAHGVVVLDQLPADPDHQGVASAFRGDQGLPGGQALLLWSGGGLRDRGGALHHRGHDLVSHLGPPGALVVIRAGLGQPGACSAG